MKGLALTLVAIGGLLAGTILGAIVAFLSMVLSNNGASMAGPIAAQVVLDLAVAFGIYRTLVSKGLSVPTRVFFVAAGASILGALSVCTTIVASSSAHG